MKKLLTRKELADYLGVSEVTIYGWTSKKKIPFRKVGRLLRFDIDEIEAWTMAGHEVDIKSKKRFGLF